MTSTTPRIKKNSMLHAIGWVVISGVFYSVFSGVIALGIILLLICIEPKALVVLKLQNLLIQTLRLVSTIEKGVFYAYLERILQWLPQNITTPSWTIPILSTHKQQHIWLNSISLMQTLLLGLKLYIVRLYIFLMQMPLVLCTLCIAFVDGLTQRNIRRHTVSRESALLYHQVKMLTTFSLFCLAVIDLSLPLPIKTLTIISIIALLITACLLQITVKQFKKYL